MFVILEALVFALAALIRLSIYPYFCTHSIPTVRARPAMAHKTPLNAGGNLLYGGTTMLRRWLLCIGAGCDISALA